MSEVNLIDYIKRATQRAGILREKFTDKHLPLSSSQICVVPFFGDLCSEFILSSFILHRLKKENRYLILCSYPKHSGVFPYVDEYWTIEDETALKNLSRGANGFFNESVSANTYEKALLRYFDNVISMDNKEIAQYYNNGFSSKEEIRYKLPFIPSVQMELGETIYKIDYPKIFIYPTTKIRSWRKKQEIKPVKEEFWVELIKKLIEEKYLPVIYEDYSTYDLSSEFYTKCVYIKGLEFLSVLGVMRMCDCTIDVFSGISRFAIMARSPYLSCDDRQRYMQMKEYEIDDLCTTHIPYQIAFTFSPIIEGKDWMNTVKLIIAKIKKMIPIDKDKLPSTMEVDEVLSYDKIRKKDIKRLGMRFIKPKEIIY